MKKTLPLLSVAVVAVIVYFAFFNDKREINVLVFSKTDQFRHDSIEPGIDAIRQLGQQHGFSVEATEDATIFEEQSLQRFNVVVFLNTTGDVLNDAQQLEMNRFIQAGGGFVGVHAAADTEYEWPWYGLLVGGYFDGHPNDPNVREGVVLVAKADEESTSHLPHEWTRTDEWYDYKSFNPDVTVVLNVDETSYKRADENPASDPRPISWQHDFDGGRSFYTGLGHTKESYEDPAFLAHLWGGISFAAGPGVPVDYNNATVAPEENRFSKRVLTQNLVEPMELDLLGNGRIIFVERGGAVKIHDENMGTTETIATFDTFSGLEEGLLGVAVDPDYTTNKWVYFSYSASDVDEIRISRFDLDGNNLDFGTEKVLLTIPVQRDECCHVAGSMEFDAAGNLFFSIGDNTSPHSSDGYGPFDERPGREPFDAQKSSSNANDLRGSIMRITPQDDGTYTIPNGNLFPKDGSQGRPEIYVLGNRNPFRISIDNRTGFLYWGEVGPDAGSDSLGRGPKGHDEVNQAREAGFFGWPYFVGDNKPYNDYDFETGESGDLFDVDTPINDSPSNTGIRELPPAQPAFIWYPYGVSEEFPLVGSGGRNAMAGPVYYVDDYGDSEIKLPEYYNGKLFIYEWMRGWIMAVTMDENGDYVRMEPFLPSMEFSNPMDMLFAPDGSIYMLEYGPIWFAGSPEAKLTHITYIKGNRAPVANIAANQTVGAAPLSVNFTSESIDYDGDNLTYVWDFGTGETSTEANPTHTFSAPGTYRTQLTITDPEGETATTDVEIMVGNEMPSIAMNFNGNASFYWDNATIDYEVVVTDAEDGSLADGTIDPSQVTLTFDFLERGSDLALPAMGHKAMMDASRSLIGQSLVDGSDCSACHQPDMASVGPSYVDIASKYQSDAAAVEMLATKIIEGGSGNWGDVAMAAHPQIAQDEAVKMVEYILSLAGDTPSMASAPLQGSYALTEHIGKGEQGSYVIIATYTDQGGDEIGPLTTREMITLRYPRLMAALYDDAEGGQRFTVPDDAPGGMGGQDIFLGAHGAWQSFTSVDMTDVAGIKGTFAVAPTFTTGGFVDVYLDSIDGTLLGTFEVEQSLTDIGIQEVEISFDPLEERHDLIISYRNEDEEGTVCIGIMFDFTHKNQTAL